MDADGDGRAQELVRWRPYCDYDRPPFLVIHDLSRPGAPVMVALELNPQAGRNSREYITETVDVGPGRYEVRVTSRLKTKPDRTGRWRFESSAGLRDILVEESVGGDLKEVARFTFDPRTHRWTGPAGNPGAFWQIGTDSWLGARFTDYTPKTR